MSHRTFLLVSRSSIVLIAALVAAPLWDFWRFGGIVPAGGGGFPVAAILPVAQDAGATAPDRETTRPADHAAAAHVTTGPGAGAIPAAAPAVASTSSAATSTGATSSAAPGSAATRSTAPAPRTPVHAVEGREPTRAAAVVTASSNGYEAWTAWGQVDPFWDGVQRPARTGRGAPIEDEPATPADPAPETAPPARSERHAGGDEPGDAGPARAAGDATGDGSDPVEIDGWVIGPMPPPAVDVVDEPVMLPPPPGGGGSSGGGVAPATPTREPRPRATVAPSVRLDAPTGLVDIGPAFDVAVRVDSVEAMTSLPFHLHFDPAILTFVGAQTGTALSGMQPVLLASVNPNRPGDLAVGLSLIELSGSFSGAGQVIVLRFQAIASGRSDLSFSHATLRGATSEPVDTRFLGTSVNVR